MRPGSNGTTARPRIREQHPARLNARPTSALMCVSLLKSVCARAFACARDTLKVCPHITFACVIPLVVSLVLFEVSLVEKTCALFALFGAWARKTYGLHYDM